jgi:hypothetical protein
MTRPRYPRRIPKPRDDTPCPICPWCDYRASPYMHGLNKEGDMVRESCDECGKSYMVTLNRCIAPPVDENGDEDGEEIRTFDTWADEPYMDTR